MATLNVRYATGLSDTPIGKFFHAFNDTNKRGVFKRVSVRLWNLVRKHFREIEPTHHKTADSFSPAATPTGYWERAQKGTTLQYTAQSGTVTIDTPGISRAFHPLDIRMKDKLLTIPARPSPEAYGRTASQVSTTERLFFAQTRSGVKMLATSAAAASTEPRERHRRPPSATRPKRHGIARPKRENKNGFRPVFWLRESVHIKQERGILPSDKEITEAATEEFAIGVRDFVLGRK